MEPYLKLTVHFIHDDVQLKKPRIWLNFAEIPLFSIFYLFSEVIWGENSPVNFRFCLFLFHRAALNGNVSWGCWTPPRIWRPGSLTFDGCTNECQWMHHSSYFEELMSPFCLPGNVLSFHFYLVKIQISSRLRSDLSAALRPPDRTLCRSGPNLVLVKCSVRRRGTLWHHHSPLIPLRMIQTMQEKRNSKNQHEWDF